ncbi:MAG: sigma-70 family RNA polymerase sigma factor [Lachnospiraceae bacterium]|nr:sigma-70 family RNA polymerase sigma factor [Lachnospiraceae bacterium]
MESLIARAKEGDADAFAALIQKHMKAMYKVGWSILKNDEDVADAIQDAILTAFERLDQLKESRVFPSWLTRILVNKCYDLLRMKTRVVPMEILPEEPTPDAGYGNVEWKEALSGLEEKYRLILILYYIEGFKTGEIGQILEIPEATVRTRLSRGRKQLFVMYHEEGAERRPV